MFPVARWHSLIFHPPSTVHSGNGFPSFFFEIILKTRKMKINVMR